MQNPTCPKCYYPLVFLESRLRFKCPKCGKLFLKKEIETKEFVEWNKKQRKADKETINGKPQKQTKLTEFQKKQRASAYFKKWYEKNKDKRDEYYMNNRDNIIQQKREYRKALSEQQKKQQNKKRNVLRMKNLESTRVNLRIDYWKRRQKQLALQKLEFEYFKALESYIKKTLLSRVHSELLEV